MNYWTSSVNGSELEKEGAEIPEFAEFECQPSLEGLRVLVVDEDKDTHEMFYAVLSQCGAEFVVAASTSEAWRSSGEGRMRS